MSPTLRRRKNRKAAEPTPASDQPAKPADESDDTPDDTSGDASPDEASEEPSDKSAEKPADKPADKAAEKPAHVEPTKEVVRRRSLAHTTVVLLARAAHPRQALLTAAGMAIAAAISGRSEREIGLVFATVLVGQAVLGWHNDLVDRTRDKEVRPPEDTSSRKPFAIGLLDPGTGWFALTCGVLLLVPLSVSNGITAGCAYLASIAIGMVGNVVLRRGMFSWVPWAAAYALYPAFLSYGGWGGDATGYPPQVAMVVLAALLGVGVHFLVALPGLVPDYQSGDRHLPLRVARKIGATKLLVISLIWIALVIAGLLFVGNNYGLTR